MSLDSTQIGRIGSLSGWFTKKGGNKWLKNQRSRKLRRQAKDITKESPQLNKYHGWVH